MVATETALLSWDVSCPEKQSSTFSTQKKPCGTLVIESDGGCERMAIPAQVARRIVSKRKAGEFEPLTREGLMNGLREMVLYCARMRVERLINRREYAADEVRAKLRDDGYDDEVIESCVGRAIEVGLVSDRRFAESFIHSKVAAGWGIARIERELGRRGIHVDELAGWPYDFIDPDGEFDRAMEIISRRRITGKHPYEKIVRNLASRGFSLDGSHRVARSMLDGQDADADMDW